MARYWAVAALQLAECDYVPLDYSAYAVEVQSYLDETERAAREKRLDITLAQRGRPLNVGRALVVQHWKRREKQLRVVIQRAWNACTKR